ncbi:MAG: Cna B-type domain-containing protein, partial [Coriobacteriales bacterium]
MHDGDTLDNIVTVPKGTYLVVKSDQGDHDANVQVTKRGGFVVETGGVLVLENVNLSGNGKDRSMPVFSVYGDMVMNDGAIGNFSSTSAGASSDYGNGGFPAVSVVDGTFTMNDGAIFGNSNTTTKEIAFGGALRAQGRNAAVIINDGRICGNRVLSSATVPYGSTVTANALGGAIAVTEGASITVNGGEISYNTAGSHAANAKGADNSICSGNGGAIAVYSSSRETISSLCLDGGRIVHNNAYRSGADKGAAAPANNETHGGGIFSSVYTRAALNAGKIARNTSDDKGGGAFLDCNKACGGASLKSTLVSGNEAESLGGGLWFCPNGEAKTFNEAKADGVAVFDNTTARRGTDGAGDDLYVSPRSGASGVTVTSTMLGGGSNAWYKDGGAATQKTSNYSSRYTSSGSGKTAVTLLQASAVVNKPSAKARSNARKSSNVEITGNRAKYGGGVGSNHYLKFGSVASDDKFNVTPEPSDPEKISINVKKTWIGDAGNAATVHLLADGEKVASATLNADNNWTYTFTGLDQEDSDGNEIAYTVAEDAVEGYSTEIAGDASEGFTVTNTNTETVDVSGAKVWDDDGDRDGLRPGSVTVNLLRDGTAVGSQTVASDGDSSWPFAFEDLAKYDSDGHEYSY